MGAIESSTSLSGNSAILPVASTRTISGLASGPVPRETVRKALPVSGLTAMSLISKPLGVVPSMAAIFSSSFSTFGEPPAGVAGFVARGNGVYRRAGRVAHQQNSLRGKRGRTGRFQLRRSFLHTAGQIGRPAGGYEHRGYQGDRQ